uniref:Glycosyltransferase family 92 protein n=1 Tax=Globodera rostochiensis TaxID=31243 RepID=A0A914GTY7_GLORO
MLFFCRLFVPRGPRASCACPLFCSSPSFPYLPLPPSSASYSSSVRLIALLFRLIIVLSGIVSGFALYHRTTNMWTLKNLGDSVLVKRIGRRPIVLGAFRRPPEEQNVRGHFAVFQFLGDARQTHALFCVSEGLDGKKLQSEAHIQRIHQGKRAANDICAWSGHLAECQLADGTAQSIRLSPNRNILSLAASAVNDHSIEVPLEKPLHFGAKKFPLVVCVAPMYTYTEWQIMVTGIEAWLALGASKMIFPIQSSSADTILILTEYQRMEVVHLRMWPKWPVLSDVNPNGLVLSRGIEESHVNCLHFVKPFAEIVVFTDIDDMLMPLDPLTVRPGINVELLKGLFQQHPNAGSLLFEHRDVQFVLPDPPTQNTLHNFNFEFLAHSQWKTNCKVWRMKTRVAVNASRVDTVNMHESGIHRLGFVQVRVPCRQAHFYHLRHSYKNIAINEWPIDMAKLRPMLNERWRFRVESNFSLELRSKVLARSSVDSFEDFDKCMGAINEEHWRLRVSRCLTPHVCFSRLAKNISCVATTGDYEFVHSDGDFISVLRNAKFVDSESNCEAPVPQFVGGNHFYMP